MHTAQQQTEQSEGTTQLNEQTETVSSQPPQQQQKPRALVGLPVNLGTPVSSSRKRSSSSSSYTPISNQQEPESPCVHCRNVTAGVSQQVCAYVLDLICVCSRLLLDMNMYVHEGFFFVPAQFMTHPH